MTSKHFMVVYIYIHIYIYEIVNYLRFLKMVSNTQFHCFALLHVLIVCLLLLLIHVVLVLLDSFVDFLLWGFYFLMFTKPVHWGTFNLSVWTNLLETTLRGFIKSHDVRGVIQGNYLICPFLWPLLPHILVQCECDEWANRNWKLITCQMK